MHPIAPTPPLSAALPWLWPSSKTSPSGTRPSRRHTRPGSGEDQKCGGDECFLSVQGGRGKSTETAHKAKLRFQWEDIPHTFACALARSILCRRHAVRTLLPLPPHSSLHPLNPLTLRRQAVRAKYGDVRARKLAEAASVVNELLYKATVSITQAGEG